MLSIITEKPCLDNLPDHTFKPKKILGPSVVAMKRETALLLWFRLKELEFKGKHQIFTISGTIYEDVVEFEHYLAFGWSKPETFSYHMIFPTVYKNIVFSI